MSVLHRRETCRISLRCVWLSVLAEFKISKFSILFLKFTARCHHVELVTLPQCMMQS